MPLLPTRLKAMTSGHCFTFEESFSDTVSILIAQELVLKQYRQTTETGSAGRVQVKADPWPTIIIEGGNQDCTQFVRGKGFKHIYAERAHKGQWSVTYSTSRRYYF